MLGKICDTLVGGALRNVPGGLGQRLRALYWRRRFRRCGRIKIDEGVIFHNPERIEIGDNVWIMAYAVLTAPYGGTEASPTKLLRIGDEVQVGAFNVINAGGGMEIGNCVTLSARVSLYSATHLPRNPDDPSEAVGCNGMVRSLPVYSREGPITIGGGAWIGLHAVVICCDVGEQAFVTSGTVLSRPLADGMRALPDGSTIPRYHRIDG